MTMRQIYICDTCGKISSDPDEIMECESQHLGLTVSELHTYQALKSSAAYCGTLILSRKDDQTERLYDKAIRDLAEFEKSHNLKNGVVKDSENYESGNRISEGDLHQSACYKPGPDSEG